LNISEIGKRYLALIILFENNQIILTLAKVKAIEYIQL